MEIINKSYQSMCQKIIVLNYSSHNITLTMELVDFSLKYQL